jgi:hypothetical protein
MYIATMRDFFYITVVHEAAVEKAQGASGMDIPSNGGKELKCYGILHWAAFPTT